MSIIIKGMRMPERCGQCFLRVGNCKQRIYMEQRPKGCPLVEIPTPHGRLIDADELIRELASNHVGGLKAIEKHTGSDTWESGLHTAWRTIDDADTVIEAEGREK